MLDRQLAAMAQYLQKDIATVNVLEQQPSADTVERLSNKLRVPVQSLVDLTNPYFRANYDHKLIQGPEWVELLVLRPSLLKTPIGERERQAYFVHTITQLQKLADL